MQKINKLKLHSYHSVDDRIHKITIPSCSEKEIELLDNKDLAEDIITSLALLIIDFCYLKKVLVAVSGAFRRSAAFLITASFSGLE